MHLILSVFVLAIACQATSAHAQLAGRWETKGSDVLIGLTSDPLSPSSAGNSVLVVGYSPKTGCQAVVSFLVMKGMTLGPELWQKMGKTDRNRMFIIVNQRQFSAETVMIKYANAVELAMRAPAELISALEKPSASVVVKVGSTEHLKLASTENFSVAHKRARGNCKAR
jgi:hypothetical protein